MAFFARIAAFQKLPLEVWRGGAAFLDLLVWSGIVDRHLPRRVRELSGSDDTSVIHAPWCWIREEEHRQLCRKPDCFLGYPENTPFLFFHNNGDETIGFVFGLLYKAKLQNT